MASSPFSQQNLFSSWNAFFEPFTQFYQSSLPGMAGPAKAAPNPWVDLMCQAWNANPFSKVVPLDPAEIVNMCQSMWLDTLNHPELAWSTSLDFMQKYAQILESTVLKTWGSPQTFPPTMEPAQGDKRFSAPDWQLNPLFDFLKQSYLLVATTLLKAASEKEGLTLKQQQKLSFYLRQFLDAISPTNTLFTNPEVLRATVQSGGQNLVRGMQNLLRDMQAGQIKMTDTDAFQPGRNLATTPGQVVYRNSLIELIQYTPATEQVYALPLLFLPPWINKYYILDLKPQNSLVQFLVGQGYTVFVVSWKNPDASMEETSFEDYLALGPLAALEVVKEITGCAQVNAVGYCIGGTLLAMALSYLAAKEDPSIHSATFLVSLLDFSAVGDSGVFFDEPQLNFIEGQLMQRGYLDSRSMAAMFNMLRANDLIWSNVINNYLMGQEPPAFDLLYWNSDGTRMARAAHTYYLRNTYLENNLIQPDKLVFKGTGIDLRRIRQEIYAVGTQQDHIVPWQSAWRISQLVSGPVRFVLAASGHIAGVVSPPEKDRGYWTNQTPVENAEAWLMGAEQHAGSWWTDWSAWLSSRSGERIAPPAMGSAIHPPLMPAPGQYVLEK